MISETKREVLSLFDEGRLLYKSRAFAEAMSKFAEALKLDQEDGPSKVYYARCKMYLENPPPPEWDGVFIMTTK
ncbi:hypothetical protein [Oceanispirochaeta sp.]|jgi:hypothetical protein|uniref:hypothetical protein n=1 Tax=Oceanispirochaeta sp. TaxID=2035350 RepID=UPI0026133817|nr:hypothetical protein [Oceanispirochaeta sp.]MDA3956298.1 hypothetical protein [Oceanispirochaeta sp.]